MRDRKQSQFADGEKSLIEEKGGVRLKRKKWHHIPEKINAPSMDEIYDLLKSVDWPARDRVELFNGIKLYKRRRFDR